MKSFVRSVVAVAMGFMVIMLGLAALQVGLIKVFHLHDRHFPVGYLVAFAAGSMVIYGLGGFVTAVLARYRPIEHGAALSGIVFVLSWLQYRTPMPGIPVWFLWVMGAVPPFVVLTGSAFYPPKPADRLAEVD